MKVYNLKHNNLNKNLIKTLNFFRTMRNFSPKDYIYTKANLLNEYMLQNNLNSCVVAVSGGIDSSIVLGIVNYAYTLENSPIKKITPISLPVFDEKSATNQESATNNAKTLCDFFELHQVTYDVYKSFEKISFDVEKNLQNGKHDNWARGQLSAYARTPYLYYSTSSLSSQGFSSIIVGTTNRDEGAYLGYVGKASDGMVDVQLISDLHKSEVYAVAKELSLPKDIISQIPSGDMYDGRFDEEVFGAPYDFVELYLNYKNVSQETWHSISNFWEEIDKLQFNNYSKALEKLHNYNKHKYWSGSQAIHLDIMSSAVNGGWIDGVHSGIYKNKEEKIIPTHKFIGFCDSSPILETHDLNFTVTNFAKSIKTIENFITKDELSNILNWHKNNSNKEVKTNYYGNTKVDSKLNYGSKRLSFYNKDFSKILKERLLLSKAISELCIFDKNIFTNWTPFNSWRLTEVNPMVRLLNYSKDDLLFPHYDDSFYLNKKERSLYTLVIVIENECIGGATRFLKDDTEKEDFTKRTFNDLNSEPSIDDIFLSLKPNPGTAILFPHRLLHDGEKIISGNKKILRTELMFEINSTSFLKINE